MDICLRKLSVNAGGVRAEHRAVQARGRELRYKIFFSEKPKKDTWRFSGDFDNLSIAVLSALRQLYDTGIR